LYTLIVFVPTDKPSASGLPAGSYGGRQPFAGMESWRLFPVYWRSQCPGLRNRFWST